MWPLSHLDPLWRTQPLRSPDSLIWRSDTTTVTEETPSDCAFLPDKDSGPRFLAERQTGPAPRRMLGGRMQEELIQSPKLVSKKWEEERDVSSSFQKVIFIHLTPLRKYGYARRKNLKPSNIPQLVVKSHSVPQPYWGGSSTTQAPSEHQFHGRFLCKLGQATPPLKAICSSLVKQGDYWVHRLVARINWNIFKALTTLYELHKQFLLMTLGFMSFQFLLYANICHTDTYVQ